MVHWNILILIIERYYFFNYSYKWSKYFLGQMSLFRLSNAVLWDWDVFCFENLTCKISYKHVKHVINICNYDFHLEVKYAYSTIVWAFQLIPRICMLSLVRLTTWSLVSQIIWMFFVASRELFLKQKKVESFTKPTHEDRMQLLNTNDGITLVTDR